MAKTALVVGIASGLAATFVDRMVRCGGATGGTVVVIDPDQLRESERSLKAHVEALAGRIGERNVSRPEGLRRAAEYISRAWAEMGYAVASDTFRVDGVECANLEVSVTGEDRPWELLVVGAHYDSAPGTPGADDNASGVAAMLEISRRLAPHLPKSVSSTRAKTRVGAGPVKRSLRFVAFVNEESPFFGTAEMGSRIYARRVRAHGEAVHAMLSLETLGFYAEERNSQRYPPLFNLFYPDRGNFVAFVSNLRSRSLLGRCVRSFREYSDFPVECASTFAFVPGVGWSDHDSFWREGYPALMVTDTAFYRNPHYHTAADTPDKLDYPRLARVTDALGRVVLDLATSP